MGVVFKTMIYNGEVFGDIEINEFGEMRNVRTGWTYVWYVTDKGYHYTLVHIGGIDGKKKKKRILKHRAVAWTFIENPLKKPQINHIDGNKLNNHISNLEWCTAKENNDHSWKIGLSRCYSGEETGRAKLTRQQVIYVLENYRGKSRLCGAKPIAKKFNVPVSVIRNLISGQSWVKFVKEYKNEKLHA